MYTCTNYCSSSLLLVLPYLLASLIQPMADADAYSSSYHPPHQFDDSAVTTSLILQKVRDLEVAVA